ncbi:MAG: alkaline phosphatase family protein [Gaiellaceae bacterium]
MRRRLLAGMLVLVVGATGVALAQSIVPEGAIGPDNHIQPSGRKLDPPGTLTKLGNHPGGGALTPDGRFLWTLSAGRGRNDVRIVDVSSGAVVQTIPMPGVDGGIAMAPDGRTAYVSGTPESTHKDEQSPASTPGKAGDVIHVFRYDGSTGQATRDGTIGVPGGFPVGPTIPQNFPPTNTKPISWPRDIAVSSDGSRLLVALNLADRAAVIDTKSRKADYVKVGSFPYGAAVTPDGKRGFVSNEADGTVSVIDMDAKSKIKDVQVGTHLSHPEGMAMDPSGRRLYVAVAHQDLIAVVDTSSLKVERTLSVERPQGIGTEPTALSVTQDGCRLMAADSGEDAVAVFSLRTGCENLSALGGTSAKRCTLRRGARHRTRGRHRRGRPHAAARHHKATKRRPRKPDPCAHTARRKNHHRKRIGATLKKVSAAASAPAHSAEAAPFTLLGRVPTASYPVAVGATPDDGKLVWIAAKGLGVGPNPHGPNPLAKDDADDTINNYGYLPSIVTGMSGVLTFPSDAQLNTLSPESDAQIHPVNPQSAPTGTPIAPPGPDQKIKHVFYIVRENRTYDQILGDDSRGDGDPSLELFPSSMTPNYHALAQRFPLLDHVYANSEASIDGHFWTSAGAVSDYVTKNWHANYGGRQRPYDFGVYSITWPAKGFLFDQAEKQGISYFNYGEAIAGVVPVPDKDRTPDETAQVSKKFANSDLGPGNGCYPNDADIGTDAITQQDVYDSSPPTGASPTAESRFDCFKKRFDQQVSSGNVPAFNYLVISNDHTNGTSPGARTPQAMIADNDYGLGQTVDLISHSPVWSSSLILVIEDDSQDGADHVDAHRIPALAISPFAKQGAVVHTRYDFLSFIRTLEIPIGMNPLNLYDSLATPLYDVFDSTAQNTAPYSAIVPSQSRIAVNTASAPAAALSKRYNLQTTDQIPQRTLDGILWKAVHGAHAKPPPPGPNAVRERPGADGDG